MACLVISAVLCTFSLPRIRAVASHRLEFDPQAARNVLRGFALGD
jgi:hypothetical protein